jgi:xanthine dehydrogenase accessory factor
MICGGRQKILIEHLPPTQSTIGLLSSLLNHWQAGRRSVLYTAFVQHGDAATVLSRTLEPAGLPSELPASLRQEVADLAASARLPFTCSEGRLTVLVEPIRSPGTVFIAGSGHVGQATAALCATVGFRTVVLDDREDFLSRDRLPQADELRQVQGFEACFKGLEVTPDGFIVILTRGHIHDRAVLAQALGTPAGYIGMIGSLKKRDAIYQALLEEGFATSDLDRVHCPIGLSIGADTPEEIAVSIVAELIQQRAHAT